MNLTEHHRKLIAAARRNAPADAVPYAFEKRIMARLSTAPRPDEWLAWVRALWVGAGACAAVALCLTVWSYQAPDEPGFASNFAQDLEQTILDSTVESENLW